MRPIKMLGLAMLVALMAMAFVGAGSAMAESTALCAGDEEACAEPVEHVHEETLSGVKAQLLSSILNVECDVLFLGDTLVALASPLVIHGAFTYSNCNNSCTGTEENSPAEIKVLKEGGELAKVTGEYLLHLVCSAFINCRYNGVGLTWHGLGALTSLETNGSNSLSEQTTNKESGALCPSTAKLDIVTTPLEPTYLGGEVPLKMVCIEVGPNAGLFTGSDSTGTKCEGGDGKTYSGKFELGWAAPGTGREEMKCVWVGTAKKNFWLTLAWFGYTECGGTSDSPNRTGEYELGVTA